MRTGQARKRDEGEAEIVQALRDIGVTVLLVSGDGCPDLLCHHWREGWQPLEVKRRGGALTPAQQATRRLAAFPVVTSIAEALVLFGVRS